MQLREQSWQFDELGTQMITPAPAAAEEAPAPQSDAPAAHAGDDPLARIEQRLDDLAHAMNALQRRLDSIDVALARVLARG